MAKKPSTPYVNTAIASKSYPDQDGNIISTSGPMDFAVDKPEEGRNVYRGQGANKTGHRGVNAGELGKKWDDHFKK